MQTDNQNPTLPRSARGAGAGSPADVSAVRPRNRLLELLPDLDRDWLLPFLEDVTFESGAVLVEQNSAYTHLYFPDTAVCSIVNRLPDGAIVEVGTVGREGVAGLAAFLADGVVPSETVVQVPGSARRAPASLFEGGLPDHPAFRGLLQRYAQAYIAQVSQTAACNARHSLEERCARWLLMTHDRVGGGPTFPLTQQFLAFMLGVRRAGVTEAAGRLERAGLIRNQRGRFTVLDRDGLEAASCGCYAVVRQEYERLLGVPMA